MPSKLTWRRSKYNLKVHYAMKTTQKQHTEGMKDNARHEI